jgi:hypothetical protein
MKTAAVFAGSLAGILLAVASSAEVYRWTDEHGRVHFSDKPPRDQQAENISDETRSVNVDTSSAERKKLNQLFAPETAEEKRLRETRSAAQAQQRLLDCEKA